MFEYLCLRLNQFVPHIKTGMKNMTGFKYKYFHDLFCSGKLGYGVGRAECYTEFRMFKQIANCLYQNVIISKDYPDFSLGSGVC